ncbi:MAG: alginate lyase family protein, partial [Candidatus Firestonebacteria bacterium]
MKIYTRAIFALLSFLIAITVVLPAREYPSLLFKKEDVAKIKDKIAKYSWARNVWEKLKLDTESSLAETIELPPRGGGWNFNFICNTHNSQLKALEKIGPWEWKYKCASGGEILTGNPGRSTQDFDGVMIWRIHNSYARSILNLGLAYQLTGEKKYFEKCRALLLAYAEKYQEYKLHDNDGRELIGGGKISSNTLNEATWLIYAVEGADLIWEELNTGDREKIAEKLFLPAARKVLLPSKYGVHNIQCWKNTATGLIGLLTGDRELLEYSINDPKEGYREQLKAGVLPDGMWWESTWNYHFFALNPLVTLAEAAHNNGIELYSDGLKKMFDVALDSVMPNGLLPNFNDSGFLDLKNISPIYEIAYLRFGAEKYRNVILKNNRENILALVYGSELEPASVKVPAAVEVSNGSSSGYVVLSAGEGEQAVWLCLKHGLKGNDHTHLDKLSFILYSNGKVLSPDPGTFNYSSNLYTQWYKTSLAHNTLVVDLKNQKRTEGSCIKKGTAGTASFTILEAGKIYDTVKFLRTVILLDKDTMLFVDRVDCDKPRILDIAYHNNGKFLDLLPGEPWEIPGKPGYAFLKNAKTRELKESDVIRIADGASMAAVSVLLNEPTTLIT